jgi:hypothetical protein
MTTAFNMATGEEMIFDDNTTPEYAVAYAHYTSTNMASWFFRTVQDAADQKRQIPLWVEKSKFIYGKKSISLGDWGCINK